MEVHAYAKLNLALDILRKREDGYHDLRMVMHSVSLADTLTVTPADGKGKLTTNLSYLPLDGSNLAVKAAEAFRDYTGSDLEVDISIEKRIPICAGMAGGSSDAAAVLLAMNELTGTGLSPAALAEIGRTVGSDVPYCLMGGTALAEGRGEILTPLPPLPACSIVLCKPSFSISTARLFSQVDVKKIRSRPDTAGMLDALSQGNLEDVARRMYNVFEDFLEPRRKSEIFSLRSDLIDCGALGACMTGSGPTVFGLFSDSADAGNAAEVLSRKYRSVFLCENTTQGPG